MKTFSIIMHGQYSDKHHGDVKDTNFSSSPNQNLKLEVEGYNFTSTIRKLALGIVEILEVETSLPSPSCSQEVDHLIDATAGEGLNLNSMEVDKDSNMIKKRGRIEK